MKRTLQPIVHRVWYTRQVEDQIAAYFREAVFGPLLDMVADAGFEPDPKDQGPPSRIRNAKEKTPFPPSCSSLQWERIELPQVEDQAAIEEWLTEQGVRATLEEVPPDSLRPSQDGYYPEAVEKAKEFMDEPSPIIVSSDCIIVDGHHRWFAFWQENRPIEVLKFDAPFEKLVDKIRQFPGAVFRHAKAKPSTLADALRTGRLWYHDGAFYSDRMDAALAKQLRALGAKRDARTGAFMLPVDRVPMELRVAVGESSQSAIDLGRRVVSALNVMEGTVAVAPTGLNFSSVVERITQDIEQQFAKTVDGLEGITVRPSFTPESRAAVTKDFTEAIDLPIKGFTQEQVRELRGMVEKNTLEGGRADRLAAIIEARFGVAKRKAVFLAGQETSLMISAYREHKYRGIGSRTYKWSTSHDERVRHAHRVLDGKFFQWSDPPLIQGTTRHCNPGEDFNCRCVPLPVIEIGETASILP